MEGIPFVPASSLPKIPTTKEELLALTSDTSFLKLYETIQANAAAFMAFVTNDPEIRYQYSFPAAFTNHIMAQKDQKSVLDFIAALRVGYELGSST
jgi:hypothetical protein